MVCDVFSLHKISGGDGVKFPFPVKDYQRYVFGDDKLAHLFGTDLAKAFIARTGAAEDTSTGSNQELTTDVVVAVLSDHVPTATHNLREHFTAYLNRHLVSEKQRPAHKIDLIRVTARDDPHTSRTSTYHVDLACLGSRALIILGDIRMSTEQEEAISNSFKSKKIENTIVFAYLATLDESVNTSALSSTLSSIVSPSIKDIDSLAHSRYFSMTEAFARFVLSRDYAEFCRFLRGQDDFLARKLLDYAIGGDHLEDELYKNNLRFLKWEIDARESI
ncbi:hypothetical protein HBI56_070820 [Parastagonospora nodorum]|uniref:Uncharacterized protein n=2 Tax=Phaeosphaeria nodorum (strain SN15 / ATCC MYA-4574 / FGSC 10173) TaxID=321614 RepID=A0A7U2EP29_PHANO|nr:hypothetical protein SNOG_09806 [Parastagonospora nodorum SN15]KAH3920490.1 hypothetical protein HBH56_005250 [Parastagonospora nodorum]EAT83071.1 hypothetical protein SNOG_09806 [Parastagonospora nodorum SN15]KAH3937675.1 hypothetical protein HBH54_005240 [Parastagonospora nodorum]KAH3975225.1 hypothetical protein HBH51_088000 [Parastagonospora nodorum]KAH3978173.1 hypothetical protein HBH52_104750 [Parastagonospora nodorum]